VLRAAARSAHGERPTNSPRTELSPPAHDLELHRLDGLADDLDRVARLRLHPKLQHVLDEDLGGECPIICVGMDRKEIHVNENRKQVGGVDGSFRRRRGAERAGRASETRRWR
jgi:hypothetical protein